MGETLQLLIQGIACVFEPLNFFILCFGGILGIIFGALPGVGCTSGCALLLPLTFGMAPTSAIILLSSIYFGCMFGGAISAILINIPGDAPAVMTAVDGYPLARKGYPSKALFVSFVSSGIGGLIAAILIILLGTTMSTVGMLFGPPELAAIIIVAMTSIGWILGDNPINGLISTMLGLLLNTVGVDKMYAGERMTFGIKPLISGIAFVPVAIGMFGFSQVIDIMIHDIRSEGSVFKGKLRYKEMYPSKTEWKRMLFPIATSSPIGFFVGLLPGAGATSATFITYLFGRTVNKHRGDFGTGCVDGIATTESANNAASIGSFVPLLSLGIPGSGTSAVLLGGLMMWGLQPGPSFMTDEPELCWALLASMLSSDIILLLVCIVSIPLLVSVLKIKNSYLVPAIVTLCIMGSYSTNNSMTDVVIMFLAGGVGYFFSKIGIPVAPLTLGMVLGGMLEYRFRQTFTIGGGSMAIMVQRPLSLGILIFGVLFVLVPFVIKKLKKNKAI